MSNINNSRQELLKQAAAIHRANLQRNLQHRLEVARSQGNESLIRLLEVEANYLS